MTFWSNREPITQKIKCIRPVRVAEMRLVERERESVCVCVCVCVRERERERESIKGWLKQLGWRPMIDGQVYRNTNDRDVKAGQERKIEDF